MHSFTSSSRPRLRLLLALIVALSSWLLGVRSARSQDLEPSSGWRAQEAGPSLSLSAGLFVPPEGGQVGVAAGGEVGYQFALARVGLTTSGRVVGFFSSEVAFSAALASVRALWSLDLVSPFVMAAVGPGYLTLPERVSVTYQAGCGALMGITPHAAIGLEASYTQLGASGFRQVFFGPVLRASLD